jgi:membrane-associated phospholipid phosphatase
MASTDHARLNRYRLTRLPNATPRIAGFALLVVATLWLSLLAAGDGALRADVSVTRFIQDHTSPASNAVTDFGNAFGTAKVGVPLGITFALLLFWRGYPRGGALLLAATALRLANYGLKDVFNSPRPTPELVRVESIRDSDGFPSGHAQGATLLCGALLISLWPVLNRGQRIAASLVAALVVLATCYARISVGAHWPSDVLGGVLWGVILLLLASLTVTRLRTTRDSPSLPE